MACSCQGGSTGQYEIVLAEGTVPARVAGQTNSFATASEAQQTLTASGAGGYVRSVRQPARV